MRLILVRHGESNHSVMSIVAGDRGCTGLTGRGREQATALRDRLAAEMGPIDAMYSSTVPRARETAALIRPAFPAAVVRVECDLCEMHVGEGDGLPTARYRATYGAFDPVAEPDRPLAPGADSWHTFESRVRRGLATLAERHPGQTVVAVTHAGFIVMSILTTFAIPRPGTGARIDPDFTSLTEWTFLPDERAWQLLRFNDTAHLAGRRDS